MERKNLQIFEDLEVYFQPFMFTYSIYSANQPCYIRFCLCTLHHLPCHSGKRCCSYQSASSANPLFSKVHRQLRNALSDILPAFQRHREYLLLFSPLLQFFSHFITRTGSAFLHCFIAFTNQSI